MSGGYSITGEGATASDDQQAMIEGLFENSRVLLCLIGADRRMALVNPAWTQVVGWSVEELSGRLLPEILHPDDIGMLEAFLQDLQVGKAAEARINSLWDLWLLPCLLGPGALVLAVVINGGYFLAWRRGTLFTDSDD